MTAPFDLRRIPAGDETGECPDRRHTLIAGLNGAVTFIFEVSEELQHGVTP